MMRIIDKSYLRRSLIPEITDQRSSIKMLSSQHEMGTIYGGRPRSTGELLYSGRTGSQPEFT